MKLFNMDRPFIGLKRALLLSCIFAFGLGGCASNVNLVEPITSKTKLDQQQGVVVVRVINTSSYPLPFNFVTITPKNLNESKEVKYERLTALTTGKTDSTVFASPVKAGSYSVSDIWSYHSRGDWYYSRGAATEPSFGTFEVQPGKVTDLGTIIYYPKPEEDKFLNVLTRISGENTDILDNFFPFYAFDQADTLTWNEDELGEDRQSLYVSIAQNPVTYNQQFTDAQGSTYFIGKLGVILNRTPDGEWQLEAVDTNVDLTQIDQTQSGNVIIAGNEGKIFIRKDEQWQDISLPNHNNINQILVREAGSVDVLTVDQFEAEIYRMNTDEDNSAWTLMASFSTLQGWKDGEGNLQAYSAPSDKEKTARKSNAKSNLIFAISHSVMDGKDVVNISYGKKHEVAQLGDGSSKNFIVNTNTWQVVENQFSDNKRQAMQSGAVKLVVEKAGYWSWSGLPKVYRIDDNSQQEVLISTKVLTCKDGYERSGSMCKKDDKIKKLSSDSFTFVSLPWFVDQDQAIGIVSFSNYNFWTGQSKRDYKIVKTNNGGKTWQKTELKLPNEFCMSIVSSVKDRLLISCNGVSGDFYESTDLGETWQHVREHENF